MKERKRERTKERRNKTKQGKKESCCIQQTRNSEHGFNIGRFSEQCVRLVAFVVPVAFLHKTPRMIPCSP
jgi:hypothetical protein